MHETPPVLHESPETRFPRLISAGAWSAAAGRDFPPHSHRVWEVVYYRQGSIRCPIGPRVYVGQPGTILVTPPGVTHAEEAVTAYANYYLQVDAPADTPWPWICYDDAEQSMAGILRSLLRETRGRAANRDRMILLLLEQLDLRLRRAAAEEIATDAERAVCRAERLIAERSGGPIRIAQVAGEVGLSPAALRAAFASCRGYAPREYLRVERARRAVALLRTSSLTLEAVAELCGYDSASHLSRHIKRFAGCPPGALRLR